MRKYIFVLFFMTLSILSFGQMSLSWPLERAVFQRSNSNSATIWFAGQSLSGSTVQMQYRIITLDKDGNEGTPPSWSTVTGIGPGDTFRFSQSISTGWYRVYVRALNSSSVQIGTTSSVKFGVGEVLIIAGQSNARGSGSVSYSGAPATYDCVISSSQFSSNNCSSNLPVFPVFSKIATTSTIGPSGDQPWAYYYLGNSIVDMESGSGRVIPVLFLNAGIDATSVNNWKVTADDSTATSSRSLAGGLVSCYGNPNSGVGEPYRTLRNTLNFYGSIFGTRGVIWHQGESDTSEGTTRANYDTRLQGVIKKTRDHFDGNLFWAISRVSLFCTGCSITQVANDVKSSVIKGGQYDARSGKSGAWGAYASDTLRDGTTSFYRQGDRVHFAAGGLSAIAGDYYTNMTNGTSGWSIFSKSPVMAKDIPSLTLSQSGSTVTATAQSGYQCYQWVTSNGNYTNALYPRSTSCTSNASNSFTSTDKRCYLQDSRGNVRITQRVYAPFSSGTNSRIAVEDNYGMIPTKVFPNPTYIGFENTIEFELPNSARVILELIDDQGNVLKTLSDGLHDKGKYTYPFAVSNLKGDINTLYYRLVVDDITQVKRIVVTK